MNSLVSTTTPCSRLQKRGSTVCPSPLSHLHPPPPPPHLALIKRKHWRTPPRMASAEVTWPHSSLLVDCETKSTSDALNERNILLTAAVSTPFPTSGDFVYQYLGELRWISPKELRYSWYTCSPFRSST